MNKSTQRKSGVILSYVSIIASTLVQLLYTPFLTKMLGQSEYGLYSLIASIIGYLTVLDLGFGNAIIVYTAKYRANNEYEKEKKMQGMFKVIFCILAIIVAIIGVGLYLSVDSIFGETMNAVELQKAKIMMIILTFNMIITFSFNIYSAIITAYEKFVFRKIMSIVNTILKPVLMIPLLYLGFKSITMCLVITFVNILVVVSNYIYCKKYICNNVRFQGFDKSLFIEMFGYSFFIFLGVIVDKVNWSVDQFILGMVSGTIAVSVYSIASQLNQLFINLSTAITSVLLPKVSQMVAKHATTTELTNEMIKVGRIQWLIIFLMTSGFVLVGKQFIVFWVGEEYIQSYYVALLLILPMCVPLIQNLALSIMQAMNKHKFRARIVAIMALFNIAISYFLAQKYGVIGTAIGTTISLLVCNVIIMNIYYSKNLKLEILRFWKNIIKMSVPFIIPLTLILVFMHIVKLQGIIGVIIYASLYTLMYTLTVYYLSMNEYEKGMVNKVLSKLHIRV